MFTDFAERWPDITGVQAEQLVADAGDAVEFTDGLLHARTPSAVVPDDLDAPAGVRIVVFEAPRALGAAQCEGALHRGPHLPDRRSAPRHRCRVGPREPDLRAIRRAARSDSRSSIPRTRLRHTAEAVEASAALDEFEAYITGAQYLSAYNGETADYVFIDSACGLAGRPRIEGAEHIGTRCTSRHCVYPQMSVRQELYELAAGAGVDLEGLTWHDAMADSVVLGRLIESFAATFAGLDGDVIDTIAALCPGCVCVEDALRAPQTKKHPLRPPWATPTWQRPSTQN